MAWNASSGPWQYRPSTFAEALAPGAAQAAGIVGDFNTMATGEMQRQQLQQDFAKQMATNQAELQGAQIAADAATDVAAIRAKAEKQLFANRDKMQLLGPLLTGAWGGRKAGERLQSQVTPVDSGVYNNPLLAEVQEQGAILTGINNINDNVNKLNLPFWTAAGNVVGG